MAHSPEHEKLAEILGGQILNFLRKEGFKGTINETELSFESDGDEYGIRYRIQVTFQVNGRTRVMAFRLVENFLVHTNLVVLDDDAQKAIEEIKIAHSHKLSNSSE